MRVFVVLVGVFLAACSSPGSLGYVPPATITAGPPVVTSVQVVDQRNEKPNRVATIRGGYGNPLKVLDTTTPVAQEVQNVFVRALQARGMMAPDDSGPYRFQVDLLTLYGNQYLGRKAEVKFTLTVFDRAGRPVYRDTIARDDYEFTFFDNGIFSSIETLGKRVESLLDRAVDEALDNPALRNVVRGQGGPRVPGV